MAISVSDKASAGSTTNTNVYTTASHTPTANTLQTAAVMASRGSSLDPDIPTMTGNGLTWVQIANILFLATGTIRGRLTLFRALGASPSAGASTITHTNSGTGCAWSILEWAGIDTGGTDGSAAVVQSQTGSSSATTLTVTLGAGLGTNAATYASFATANSSTTFSVEAGWTEIPATEVSYITPACWLGGMRFLASTDTSATGTASSSTALGGIIIEIKEAAAAAAVIPDVMMARR